jgi:pimeloyl-ACP methyl ester carboxylesterase
MLSSVETRRRSAPAALLLALVLATAACTTSTTGTARSGSAPPAALGPFYSQQLEWGPCLPYARTDLDRETYPDPAYDCAYLTVPLDYAEPEGAAARIGVLRKKALDPANRIGSLITNPGGPGASGMNRLTLSVAPGAGDEELARRFDLVGFDPRGVGASEPTIDCLTDAERDEDRADLDLEPGPEGVAVAEADAREFVDRCVERVGVDALATAGTRDVVRDLDVLRAVLGDEKLSFLGYSYGTLIGARYADAFPDRVRALVLDGAVDPSRDPVEAVVEQGAGFQRAFEAFAADCATRPDCPLGTDPAQATTRFQELTRPLLDAPVEVGDGRVLGHGDAVTGTVRALYVEQLWEPLRLGLTELEQGSGRILMLLADDYEERTPDGRYSNLLEAFTAIRCVDEPPVTDPAVLLELDRRFREAAPFRDDGRGPLPARDSCAFWPVPPTSEPRQPEADGVPPALVVSVTGDPSTPYEAGVQLAELLGGRLLTVEGNQHTVALSGVPCVDDAVTRYLVELALPEPETECRV